MQQSQQQQQSHLSTVRRFLQSTSFLRGATVLAIAVYVLASLLTPSSFRDQGQKVVVDHVR